MGDTAMDVMASKPLVEPLSDGEISDHASAPVVVRHTWSVPT